MEPQKNSPTQENTCRDAFTNELAETITYFYAVTDADANVTYATKHAAYYAVTDADTNAVPLACNRHVVHTCFVANALTSSCKVKGFPDGQLGLVKVILIHIRCSVSCLELVKALPVVCDGSCHLHHSACSSNKLQPSQRTFSSAKHRLVGQQPDCSVH